jgi:hypothetical protein
VRSVRSICSAKREGDVVNGVAPSIEPLLDLPDCTLERRDEAVCGRLAALLERAHLSGPVLLEQPPPKGYEQDRGQQGDEEDESDQTTRGSRPGARAH